MIFLPVGKSEGLSLRIRPFWFWAPPFMFRGGRLVVFTKDRESLDRAGRLLSRGRWLRGAHSNAAGEWEP